MKLDANNILQVARQVCGIAGLIVACALLAKLAGVQISFVRGSTTELAAVAIALSLAGR